MTTHNMALVAAAILPTMVILGVMNWKGRPWSTVLFALIMGAVSAIPAVVLELGLLAGKWSITNLGSLFLFAFIVAGLVEESCKLLAYHAGPARERWCCEEYDAVLYAAAVSLGFGTVENISYVMHNGFETAGLRAFTAMPAHAVFGVLMGSYLGLARVRRSFGWSGDGLVFSGLLMAAAAHGFYDMLALQNASVLAATGLVFFLLGMIGWSMRRIRQARARSAAYGGKNPLLPPPVWFGKLTLPPLPAKRNRWASGALGFIPGLGQIYNGDRTKALLFFLIGVVNLGLYYMAHAFVEKPTQAVAFLHSLGLTVAMAPDKMAAAINQKWMLLPILMAMVCLWAVIGALDAYFTASLRWPMRQSQYAVRRSFSTHGFGTSYVLHLVVIFLLVLAPILYGDASASMKEMDKQKQEEQQKQQGQGNKAEQGNKTAQQQQGQTDKTKGGGGASDVTKIGSGGGHPQDFRLTWVGTPVTIQGWKRHPHGEVHSTSEQHMGDKQLPPLNDQGAGMVTITPGQQQVVPPRGRPTTYNEYLSYQIRRNNSDKFFFRNVPPDVWSIVRYRIAGDGTLLDVKLVKSNGSEEQAQRAVSVVRSASPYLPLPEHASAIEVTELFWTLEGAHFDPGSLEESLSRIPDGRAIKVEN